MRLLLEVLFKEPYRFITDSNYRKFTDLLASYGNKQRYKKDVIKVSDLEIMVVDYLSFIWQYKEIFVDEIYKFKSDSSAPVIFDCGANIGISCLYFSRLLPGAKIKAFEADPEIAKILASNVKDYNNVEVSNKAVWVNDDGIEISLEGADAASIFGGKNKLKVDSVRLKNLIEKENKIDMLKMDIEGAEVNVIKDCKASLNNVENIFIEFHSFINFNQELDVILKILTENNFRYFVKQPVDRKIPFVNKINKNYPEMDLQLNIFAYRLGKS